MVTALDSGSNGPGSSPGRVTALCSWTRHFALTVPLSTQAYKRVPTNLLLGVTLPSRVAYVADELNPGVVRGFSSAATQANLGWRRTPSRFMLRKPGLMGH